MRRALLALLLTLFCAQPALAAIATSGSASTYTTTDGATATDISGNFTVGSGCTVAAGCVLVVGCFIDNQVRQVDGLTFNGDALTHYGRSQALNSSTGITTEIWYRAGPDIATGTLAISITTADNFGCWAQAFTGVDQTNPFRGAATVGGGTASASYTVTVTSAVGDLVVDAIGSSVHTSNITPDASQAELLADFQITASDGCRGGGTTEAGAASVVMSGTQSSATNWAQVAGSLQPPAATQRYIVISQLRRAYETLLAPLLPHPAFAGVR